jgi:hypothetical protein
MVDHSNSSYRGNRRHGFQFNARPRNWSTDLVGDSCPHRGSLLRRVWAVGVRASGCNFSVWWMCSGPLSLVLGGEGWGEGRSVMRRGAPLARMAPHPSPLPRVRGRGSEGIATPQRYTAGISYPMFLLDKHRRCNRIGRSLGPHSTLDFTSQSAGLIRPVGAIQGEDEEMWLCAVIYSL